MQFFTIPVVAILATVAMAMPSPSENLDVEARGLETRQNCGFIVPACNGGRVVAQTNCRCQGQVERCDLWSCPGGPPNTVSAQSLLSLLPSPFSLLSTNYMFCTFHLPVSKNKELQLIDVLTYRWSVARKVLDACGSRCSFVRAGVGQSFMVLWVKERWSRRHWTP